MPHCSLPLRLLGLLALSSACYIQNCPRGGKRALQETTLRQCMPCGPGDQGRCFGPRICCGEGLGCRVGSPETAPCLGESFLASPCQPGGRPCGPEWGHCAAPGVCCDAESCTLDSDCQGEGHLLAAAPASSLASSLASSPGELLLRLLHLATRGQSGY